MIRNRTVPVRRAASLGMRRPDGEGQNRLLRNSVHRERLQVRTASLGMKSTCTAVCTRSAGTRDGDRTGNVHDSGGRILPCGAVRQDILVIREVPVKIFIKDET